MTEDEAKTKWCPFNRITSEGPSGVLYNNRNTNIFNPECIASACMAWRAIIELTTTQASLKPEGEGWEKKGPPFGEGGLTTYRQDWKRQTGFCGLAGKP